MAVSTRICSLGDTSLCNRERYLDVSSSLTRAPYAELTSCVSRHVYYMSWLLEFFISGTLWAVWNWLAPPPGRGDVDEKDVFGTSGPPKEDSEESVDEKDEYVAMEDEYVAMEDGQL